MSEIKKMMVDGIARMLKNIGGNPARVIGTRTNVVSLKTPPLLTDIIVKKGTPIDENFVKQAEDAFAALVGNKNASDEQIETLYDNLEFAQNMKNPKIYIADQDMNNLMRDVYYEFENAKSSIMNNDFDDARGILRYEIEENYKYPKPVRDAAADARYMITRGEGISDWEKMGYDSEKEAIDDLLNKIQEGQNKTSKDNWPDYSDPIEGQPKQIEYYDFYTDLPEDTRNPDADFIDIKNMFGEFANGGRVGFQDGGNLLSRYLDNLAASEAAAYAPTSPVYANPTVAQSYTSDSDQESTMPTSDPLNPGISPRAAMDNFASNVRSGNFNIGNAIRGAMFGGIPGGIMGGFGSNKGNTFGVDDVNAMSVGGFSDGTSSAADGGEAGAAAASAAGSNDGPGGGTFAKGGRVGFESGGFGSAKDFIESTGESELMDIYIKVMDGTLPEDALTKALENRGYKTYATGGRVQAAGGGIMATREAFKSKGMSMKAMIDWLVDKSKTKFSRQLLDRVAKQDNGPQLITDLFAQEIQKTKGATTTVGKAPKTDVKKVRAQKQKTDDIEKDLAKSGQIPVKDQTDLQKDLENITDLEISKSYKQALEGNDLDLSDDKYDAQILADYVANNKYRTDFYDLPQDVQLDLYDKSYQWLMNDKMEKAQRYKNIKIFDDAEASAMTKFMQEQDPEGFKNIERIVDDINTKNNTDAVDLEEFDVTNRKPNAKGGLNYLMGF